MYADDDVVLIDAVEVFRLDIDGGAADGPPIDTVQRVIDGAGDEELFQAGAGSVGTFDRGAAEAGQQAGGRNDPPRCHVALGAHSRSAPISAADSWMSGIGKGPLAFNGKADKTLCGRGRNPREEGTTKYTKYTKDFKASRNDLLHLW